MTKITSQALYNKNIEIKEKKKKNKWVFRRFLKTRRESDLMTCCGRLFHIRDAATGNDRSPTVVRRVRRTTSINDDAERSLHRARESAGRLSSSARFEDADPCTHLNMSTASLKSIRSFAFGQWSWRRSGVIWSNLDDDLISRAAALITD